MGLLQFIWLLKYFEYAMYSSKRMRKLYLATRLHKQKNVFFLNEFRFNLFFSFAPTGQRVLLTFSTNPPNWTCPRPTRPPNLMENPPPEEKHTLTCIVFHRRIFFIENSKTRRLRNWFVSVIIILNTQTTKGLTRTQIPSPVSQVSLEASHFATLTLEEMMIRTHHPFLLNLKFCTFCKEMGLLKCHIFLPCRF